MALSPVQQAEVDRNHLKALESIEAGATKINGHTQKAMITRGFIDEDLNILQAGNEFLANSLKDRPVSSPAKKTDVITPSMPVPTETQPTVTDSLQPAATDEARETILALRRVALDLGKALAIERVPELRSLFEAIERSDQYLFK